MENEKMTKRIKQVWLLGLFLIAIVIIGSIKIDNGKLKEQNAILRTEKSKLTRDLGMCENLSKWKSERLGVYIQIGLEQSKLIKKPSKKLRALEISLTEGEQ